ncbi:hypothetical protein B5F75_00170 [Candidatus Avelusimicrobium gallicola]|uniref:Uncharacterized protein n=1 Tax=Candidatus Avelusimicrobium gallicola TaxID=2562704 RepID=A0A1Y4DF15_9BACT|nr:hypothetical protein B5F75_00170 [Elusimicrobium sp. An273]
MHGPVDESSHQTERFACVVSMMIFPRAAAGFSFPCGALFFIVYQRSSACPFIIGLVAAVPCGQTAEQTLFVVFLS